MTRISPYYPGNGITPITNPDLNPAQPDLGRLAHDGPGSASRASRSRTTRSAAVLSGSMAMPMNWDYSASRLVVERRGRQQSVPAMAIGRPDGRCVNGISGTKRRAVPEPVRSPDRGRGRRTCTPTRCSARFRTGDRRRCGSINGVASTSVRQAARAGRWRSRSVPSTARRKWSTTPTLPKVSQAASSGLAGSGAAAGRRSQHLGASRLEMNFPILKNMDIGVRDPVRRLQRLRWHDQPEGLDPLHAGRAAACCAPPTTRASRHRRCTTSTCRNSTTFTATRYNDPTLCPNGVPNFAMGAVPSRDCGIQFQQLQGGNATLQPEKSDAWTMGFVLQPTPEISFGLDYWSYHITDSISVIGEQTIFADPTKYANLYVRCSAGAPASRTAIGALPDPGWRSTRLRHQHVPRTSVTPRRRVLTASSTGPAVRTSGVGCRLESAARTC